jgi:hypothetical protein
MVFNATSNNIYSYIEVRVMVFNATYNNIYSCVGVRVMVFNATFNTIYNCIFQITSNVFQKRQQTEMMLKVICLYFVLGNLCRFIIICFYSQTCPCGHLY